MSQDAVEKLLGRLITDEDFRECAKESLDKICRQEGLFLTEQELIIIQGIDFEDFGVIAKTMNKEIRRSRKNRKRIGRNT